MDIMSIIGFVLSFGSLGFAYILEGGDMKALLSPSAFFIILGGALGATALGFGLNQLKKFPQLFVQAFFTPKSTMQKTIDYIIMLAENARKEGLLSIEKIIENADPKDKIDPLLKRGLLMVIDGMDLEQIKEALELEVYIYEEKVKSEIAPYESLAGYAPAFGMIGTIMGMVIVLGHMAEPEKLGHSIAVAFIATLLGVVIANAVALPIANKHKLRLKHELFEKEMIIEGICSIRNGINPKILREKLSVYLMLEGDSAKKGGKGEKAPKGAKGGK